MMIGGHPVRKIIYKCLTYFKVIVKFREQLMGVQLPGRVVLEKLFILMRIDYFVAITIKVTWS